MAQWVKVPCAHEELSLNPQPPYQRLNMATRVHVAPLVVREQRQDHWGLLAARIAPGSVRDS